MVWGAQLGRRSIAHLTRCRGVLRYGVGYEKIDLAALADGLARMKPGATRFRKGIPLLHRRRATNETTLLSPGRLIETSTAEKAGIRQHKAVASNRREIQ